MTELGPTPFGPVLIVGTGMMGCSMGRLIRQSYPMATVWGVDARPEVAAEAELAGHVSAGYGIERLSRVLAEAGLVILATPVPAIVDIMPVIDFRCRDGALVTDVGSSKRGICEAAATQPRIASGAVTFVGGHPLAGGIVSGPAGAKPSRLRDAPFLCCPVGAADPELVRRFERFLMELSFVPLTIDPDEHHKLVAATSQVPHLVAAALAHIVGRRAAGERLPMPMHYRAAGRGFEMMTAKAAADPGLWASIAMSNALPIAAQLREVARELMDLAGQVEAGSIEDYLLAAQRHRADYELANARHRSRTTRS